VRCGPRRKRGGTRRGGSAPKGVSAPCLRPVSRSADSGTFWRCATRVRTVGEDLLAQAVLAGGVEVGELLGAEYRADARGAGAAEQAVDLPAARAANSSTISERVGDTYRR
jgi:hypothetical protein